MLDLLPAATVNWSNAADIGHPMVISAGTDLGFGVVLWLSILGILTFMFLTRFNPFKIIGRGFSYVVGLIANGLRAARVLPKTPKPVAATTTSRAHNIFGPLAQVFAAETRVDKLLSGMDETSLLEHNRGIFFNWISPTAIPEDTPTSSAEELEKSHLLYNYDIPMKEMLTGTSNHYFYEDVDGAFIIDLFRGNDRVEEGMPHGPDDDFYFIANSMRKTINSNVRRLSTYLTVTLASFFIINVLYSDIRSSVVSTFGLPLTADGMIDAQQYNGILPFLIEGNAFCIITFFIALFMILIFNFEYGFIQRNNVRELDTYVRSYLAYLANRFRSSQAAVMNAIGGDRLQEEAQTGITKIQWLGWRAFFVEKFLRGVFYQVSRNSYNYMVLIPLTFIVATWFVYSQIQAPSTSVLFSLAVNERSPMLFIALFGILIATYFWILLQCPAIISKSIAENAWIEYHKLRIEETTHEIVSRFMQEISNWRDRYSGGVGS